MKIESAYYVETTESCPTFSEGGRKISFANNNHLTCFKVKVDGGVIRGTTDAKCDYLLIVEAVPANGLKGIDHREQEHYIELKGSDVAHAIEQIEKTIPQLWVEKTIAKRCSYVVCTKVAPRLNTTIQQAKVRFKKNFGATLEIGEKLSPRLSRV